MACAPAATAPWNAAMEFSGKAALYPRCPMFRGSCGPDPDPDLDSVPGLVPQKEPGNGA
jgi:hypothetical protein